MAHEITPTGAVLLPLMQQRIFTLRGQQVMIDHDLATLYGVVLLMIVNSLVNRCSTV